MISSYWHHIFGLLLVNVRDIPHGRRNHADRIGTPKLHFIADELLPEALVRSHEGSATLHPPVSLQQGDITVLQQIGHAQGGGATHTGVTVHQCAASVRCSQLNFIRYLVEVLAERSQRGVGDRNVQILHTGKRWSSALAFTDVYDARYVVPNQLAGILGSSDIAEVQIFRDRTQSRQSGGSGTMHRRGSKLTNWTLSKPVALLIPPPCLQSRATSALLPGYATH